MTRSHQANVQEQFLNRLRREKRRVSIELLNGTAREGRITSFDNHCLVLNDDFTSHLMFKHAVAMISPTDADAGALRDFGEEKS
ncbi:MAG: RNA chaperone Hfq [Deltaproteobacteria bacterium]|nr:RNA chaperone Hfq [Deltaproteobacteria bacterium]